MLKDLSTTWTTPRLVKLNVFTVVQFVDQESDYRDMAVLHYFSQTRTETLNADIINKEVSLLDWHIK